MITDKLALFFDDVAAAASGASQPVHTGIYIGRSGPTYGTIIVKGTNAAAVNLSVNIEESDDKAAWTVVGNMPVAKPIGPDPALVVFTLPIKTKKKFTRLNYTLTGAATGLTVWAGVTRDHFAPYEAGLYFDSRGLVK